ncbi:MAG: glycosyltransferase [Chitinophagaceae bacterium]|nr:glycosyltransferase [Chitinophagaceae bacterium]
MNQDTVLLPPSVAIILVNWNSFQVTNDCIDSLKKIHYNNYTIIVVDNGSKDQSGQQLKQLHPDIVLLESSTNLGFTGGNNLGFEYSLQQHFEYSMMLNNDTFVEPDFLDHLITYMIAHNTVGAIQPRIHFHHNRNILWNGGSYHAKWIGHFYTKGIFKKPTATYLQLKKTDWITGCAFLVRNSILKQTGLLATKMFIYSEDVDLSMRIRALGYTLVYHPDALIYHIAGMSNKSKTKGKEGYVNPIVHYLNQRNRIWVLKKYTPWYCVPTAFMFNIFYVSLIIGYFATRGRFSKMKAVLKAVKDGCLDSM